jgi:hypothetical protein
MFNRAGIDDVYRSQWEKLQKQIMSEPDSLIIGSPTDELVEYYLSNSSFDKIEIDASQEISAEHKKEVRRISASQREDFYRDEGDVDFEFETIVIRIPIVHNKNINDLAELRTSTFTVSWSPKYWGLNPNQITLSIDIKGYGFNYSDNEEQIASLIEREKNNVDQWIGWVNNDIDSENGKLKNQLRDFIEHRKSKILGDKSKIESLLKRINIPLKKTENSSAQRIRVDHRPLVKKVRPTPQAPEDYVLDHQKVLDIISVIENQGRQFEKTPITYRNSGEEDLRNIILVGLNSLFEGAASGETFSANGKTDIYLAIDKGNILVSECKIWGGQKLYHETINQLLGYLTWRHNFAIMITFVRQKNLTKILKEIPETIQAHHSFRTGVKEIDSTHFMSQHKLNQDDDKEVEIHHLFYNLYYE